MQDLALKLPWVEPIFNDVHIVIFVKCHLCSKMVLVANWESIEKHVSKRKTHNGKWFMDPKCNHVKNGNLYV